LQRQFDVVIERDGGRLLYRIWRMALDEDTQPAEITVAFRQDI
jgi:hypothetical protein